MISRNSIMQYYLKCELGKAVRAWKQDTDFVQKLDKGIDETGEKDILKLAYALSVCCRGNSVWEVLTETEDWQLANIPIEKLILPKINNEINPLLEKANYELSRFTELAKNSSVDELKDTGRRIDHPELIGYQNGDIIQIIDGAHRAIIMALRGQTSIPCYVGFT